MTRREFVGGIGLAAASAAGAARATHAEPTSPRSSSPREDDRDTHGIRLGVASYSLREFQRNLAIRTMKELGIPYVSVKEFHIPYSSTPAEIARAVGALQKAGLTIVSGGSIPLDSDDPAVL